MGRGGLKTTFLIVLPLSLAAGFMVAGIGTAIWPPVSAWAAPLVCSGTIDVQSDYYSPPGGGSGVNRHIYCLTGAGKEEARDEITFSAVSVAALVYATIAFLMLRFFVLPRIRRRAEALASVVGFGPGVTARGVASRTELKAILGHVAEALKRGQAEINVRNITIDGTEGDDAGARLARLRQLHESGLINDQDYEAKKAEILSGL